jgi:hypothetical protein
VAGTVDDESPDRMRGVMEIDYDQRAGDHPATGGGYSRFTVVTRFDIRRGVRP